MDNVNFSNAITCDPDECSKLVPSNTCLTILSQNIRSVNANYAGLLTLLQRIVVPSDVIILSECWLSRNPVIPILDGYTSHKSSKTFNQNDGVIVYINSSLANVKVKEPIVSEANCLTVTVGADIAIIAVYRPYAFKDPSIFLKSMDGVLCELKSFRNIVFMGDINIDISRYNKDSYSLDYLDLLGHHGLFPGHALKTHGSTSLDHANIKTSFSSTVMVLESTVTDHFAVLLSLSPNRINVLNSRQIIKINEDELANDISNINFDAVYATKDPNLATKYLIEPLLLALSKNTKTISTSRRRRPIKPWITQGLLKCMRHRDNLYKKLRIDPTNEVLVVSYRRYRNFCTNLLRKAKRDYERLEFEKAGRNSKQLWRVIKSVSNIGQLKSSAHDLIANSHDKQSTINQINDYFANVGRRLADKIHKDPRSFALPDPQKESFVLLKTNEQEVERLILSLKIDCAVGWDGISSSFLKRHRNVIVPPLTHVCNLCLDSGVFPNWFKKAILHPIFKSGDRDRVENYRPISVLPALSKILEKIINTRLVAYLEARNLLSINQFGFRKNLSTADAVHKLVNHIAQKLDNGKKCVALFLDLAKAFDTVSIPILISKLESLGIRGSQLSLFRSYLTNRTQSAKIGTYYSSDLNVAFGVPQGSILGPTLFLIYMNDLCCLSLESGTIFSYADDTALVFASDNWEEAYRLAQKGFDTVNEWLNNNLLTLNISKTKIMNFSIRNTNVSVTSSLNVAAQLTLSNGSSDGSGTHCHIERVTSIKYLGIVIDCNLTFKEYIIHLSNRVRKLMYIFKQLRNSADAVVMKMTYQALCQSILLYCISSWGGAAKSHFIQIERAQRAVLKVCCSKPRLYPTVKLYEYCQVLTVRQLFVLTTAIKQHSISSYSQQTNRRNRIVALTTPLQTSFSQRFFVFLGPYLYNKLNQILSLHSLNKHNFKSALHAWLQSQTYTATEALFNVLV